METRLLFNQIAIVLLCPLFQVKKRLHFLTSTSKGKLIFRRIIYQTYQGNGIDTDGLKVKANYNYRFANAHDFSE